MTTSLHLPAFAAQAELFNTLAPEIKPLIHSAVRDRVREIHLMITLLPYHRETVDAVVDSAYVAVTKAIRSQYIAKHTASEILQDIPGRINKVWSQLISAAENCISGKGPLVRITAAVQIRIETTVSKCADRAEHRLDAELSFVE
jgi:hypothetical protein